jgi:hypothetical protein
MPPIDPISASSALRLTSGTGSVLLDVLALLDELVLGGAGEAALEGSAKLGSGARGSAGESDGGHGGCCCSL